MTGAVTALALPVAWVLALAAASPTPAVTSDSDCPSAAAVTDALVALAAPSTPSDPAGSAGTGATVAISVGGATMRIALARTGGAAPDERVVAAPNACGARAEVAAVVVAAWLRALRGPVLPERPVPPAAPAASAAAAALAAPAATPAVARAASVPPAPPPARGRHLAAGIAVEAPLSGDTAPVPALLVVLAAGLGPRIASFEPGLMATASMTGAIDVGVASGRAQVRRVALAAGPRLATPARAALVLEPHLLIEASHLDLRGDGFPTNLSDGGWELAARLGALARWGHGSLRPFVSLDGRRALTRSQIVATDLGPPRLLPAWELRLAAGVGISVGP